MRKRYFLIGAVLIGVAGAVVINFATDKAVNEIRQVVQKEQHGPENVVDLTLKGIELQQGEHGEEVWRLKAKGAWYDQKEGVIQVSDPVITYILKPDKQELVVRSARGVVNQQARVARLWENVEIERDGGYIRTNLIIYNGTSHTLNMPGVAHFDGPDLFGNATNVTWYLNENLVRAEKDVSVEMLVRQRLDDLAEGEIKDASH